MRREPEEDGREHLRSAPGFRWTLEWPLSARKYLLGLGQGSFSLHVAPEWAFHFDLEGRLRRASRPGEHYLRGLDGTVLRKRPAMADAEAEVSGQQPLGAGEVHEVFRRAHEAAAGALETLRPLTAVGLGTTPEALAEALDILGRAVRYDPQRLAAEALRFRDVYEPLGILPPDRYRSLILQATVGCSWGRCAFCTLHRGVTHRKKTPEEFRDHAREVKAFLGRALELKSGVFLGEANALEIAGPALERILEIAREEFPAQVAPGPGKRGGISAFTDVFQEGFHDRDGLARLRSLGLDRVYLGVESGDDGVLRSLRKPATRRSAAERVALLKEAELPVGLIFLVGAGGRSAARAHVEGTMSLVADLRLGREDLVYLSPLRWGAGQDSPPSPSPPEALAEAELAAQEREMAVRLRALEARVSRYDLTAFIYY